jgi:7,8-dihydropterin-6-yl-methyl-4-(beta-D-ribofuranosyl)aminobenzene 5'-phosphate synthase
MKGQMVKLFVVLSVCLSIVAGCVPTPTSAPVQPTATSISPTPTPLDVVQQYQDAFDRHDVDTAMALFTDDATYTWGDYFTSSDKTLIRNWLEYAAALNMQTTVNDCKLTDPTVTCDWRYVEECGRIGATGNFGVDATIVFAVKEGKISRIAVAPNPDPEYYNWTQAFLKWYEDTNPTEARSFTQALDTLKFGREFGERLSELCKEHAASLKSATTTTTDSKGDADAALGDLKLTILYDNTAVDTQLKSDWGFAALVEYGGHTLLFDTGADGAMLLDNMRQLDVDPQSIEAIVLSHEHYDHTGGLQALLDAGYRPTVYVPSKFGDLSKEYVRKQTQLIEVTDAVEIFPGVRTTRPVGSTVEQALVLESREGAVVITGCAHPGLVEMVRQAKQVVPGKISLLAGGFHSPMVDDSMIAELRQLGVERVLPAHCTGDSAIAKFRTEYGGNYIDGGVGRTVTASTVSRATLPASTPL